MINLLFVCVIFIAAASLSKKFYLCVGTFDVSCGLCYQFSAR